MKTIFVSFAILFALCSQPLLGGADILPDQVVDTDGNGVQPGVQYYIRPVPDSPSTICRRRRLPCPNGAGFSLIARSAIKPCPIDVGVVSGQGQAVTFSPVNPNEVAVRVSTDLNIKTEAVTICVKSTVWKLELDGSSGQRIVTIGGVIGNPGKDTISNWFEIEKYDNDYKLVYCPTVCATCKPVCGNVGVFLDSDGNQHVVLTDKPYKVRFQKSS